MQDGWINIYLYRVFCDLKLQSFKIYLKCWNVNSDKTEFRSKDNVEISAVVTVPMPLPGAFTGHFCKVLSSLKEAFFVHLPSAGHLFSYLLNFHWFFLIKRWHETMYSDYRLCWFWAPSMFVLVTWGAFDKLKFPFSFSFFLIDHLYVKRHLSKLLDYYYL